MKKILNKFSLVILFSILSINTIDAQDWLWARMIGGIFDDEGKSDLIASDEIYVFGTFQSPDCYLITDTFHNRGAEDIFLVKYDRLGSEIWARNLGGYNSGINHEDISRVVLDPSGKYLYMTGRFIDSIDIGSFRLYGSSEEVFISKCDTNGNIIWAKSAGGASDDSGLRIEIDSIGNLFLSAYCSGIANFDTYTVSPGTILAKYDTSGNCIWAKNIMRNVSCSALLNNNELFFTGNSLPNVDTVYIDTLKFVSDGSYDIFISKFDTSGNLIWSRKEGASSTDIVTGFTIDNYSNLFITGGYKDSTIINGDTLYNGDNFIMKYNNDGVFQWVKQFNSSIHFLISMSLTMDDLGNVYMTGEFLDTAFFDNYKLYGGSFFNAFLACYNTNGACIGADNIPGHGRGIAVTSSNQPVISGNFVQATTAEGTVFSHGGLDAGVIMHDRIIGIEEVERKSPNELFIYSNPTTGKCNITMPEEFLNKNGTLTLTLYDSNGKIIHSYPVNVKDGIIKLNLEYEASGIYIVTLTDGRKIYKGKIVFE